MRGKPLFILIVLTVVIAVAAVMLREDRGSVAGAGEPLFPALLENVNDVTTVVGVGRGETFTLVRKGDRWLVSEKNDYPANQEEARKLVLGIARLTRIEPKTSNPDLYGKIGLDDIRAASGNAVQYSLKNAAGDSLAEIIIGNSRLGRVDPQESEYFVREPVMAQTWLVQGKLSDAVGVIEWMDDKVLKVERDRVRQVTVTHPDGAAVTVSKKKPSQQTFNLVGVDEGEETESKFKLNDLGRSLASLDLEDVLQASEVDIPDDALEVEMTTFDGLRAVLRSVKEGDRTLAWVTTSFDESLISPEFLPGGEQAEGESTYLLSAGAVREEVARLNRDLKSWVYVIPNYRAKYMWVTKEDLMKSPEKKEDS
jgi:hypothetical protein